MPRWPEDDHDTIVAATSSELRSWLEDHHDVSDAVWFRYWKKGRGRSSLTWSEVVDEILCFGWIDTKVQSVDDDCYVQYLTRRRKGSAWSRINKEKVERLIADGRMTDAGLAAIERAKADGSWSVLDPVEDLVVPEDLATALDARPGARDFYESLTASAKKYVLGQVYLAKREATRASRVDKMAAACADRTLPPT
jgi:uncharacterized protein YdeI (YjbR/CyaY-like superfamily)